MRKGIARLLRDYYELRTRTEYVGDYDTAVMLADLMAQINGDILTPRQRQFIAIYYFVGLTFEEIAIVMRLASPSNVSDGLYAALDRLADTDNTRFKTRTPENFADYDGAVYRWLDGIAEGKPIKEPSRRVLLSIATVLSKSDGNSSEMLRQKSEGFVYLDESMGEEYPHLSDSQTRWVDRRITLVEDVFPVGDIVGSQRYTPLPEYNGDEGTDDEYLLSRTIKTTGRRKLFKLRGN